MEVKEMALPSINKFASDYVKGRNGIEEFFHYDAKAANVYKERYRDVSERSFNRDGLADCIEVYMGKYGVSDSAKRNLQRLRERESVVVIGGQQAGLLTGPLYTIHKLISVIKLAGEQERELGVPVIPVFWIAGEDHDLAEVNHIYLEKEGEYSKAAFADKSSWDNKRMVSDVGFNGPEAVKFIDAVFASLEETEYTKLLHDQLLGYCSQSVSMSDFFSFIITDLFKEYGVLLYDSGDKRFRKLQSGYLQEMVRKHREINQAVRDQQADILKKGYQPAIQMDEKNANLFLYEREERILLEFDSELDRFTGKSNEVSLSAEALLDIAVQTPGKLSNNVVTRPLMQEKLFPVLAFISGPGEIAYWAELKRVFEEFGIKMPILVPRMNITIIEPKVAKCIEDTETDLYEVLVKGADEAKERYLFTLDDGGHRVLYEKTKRQFIENHRLLSEAALQIDRGLEGMMRKNADMILGQLAFIEERIEKSFEGNHAKELMKFDRINQALRPLNGPQERTVNVFYYLNKYGPAFIDGLLDLPLETNSLHKVIVL